MASSGPFQPSFSLWYCESLGCWLGETDEIWSQTIKETQLALYCLSFTMQIPSCHDTGHGELVTWHLLSRRTRVRKLAKFLQRLRSETTGFKCWSQGATHCCISYRTTRSAELVYGESETQTSLSENPYCSGLLVVREEIPLFLHLDFHPLSLSPSWSGVEHDSVNHLQRTHWIDGNSASSYWLSPCTTCGKSNWVRDKWIATLSAHSPAVLAHLTEPVFWLFSFAWGWRMAAG